MRSSWLDDQRTARIYRLSDGTSWIVQNEYGPIKCPDCGGVQYCRLTHIWHFDQQGHCTPECHVNLNRELDALRKLLVTYVDGVGVAEAEADGRWVLMKSDSHLAVREN